MSDNTQSSSSNLDCAVCLQKCHHPTQLPCGHVFCFLCVKGVIIQNRKCAMCRAPIPADYLDHPVLLEKITLNYSSDERNTAFQWYYEGRNGWWKYDERSCEELETAWNNRDTECTLLLAGAVYSIHFANMIQTRCSDPTRRRRVRRDAATLPAKGIAGIKILDETKIESQETSASDQSTANSESEESNEVLIVSDDSNDTLELGHNDSEIDYLLENLDTLNLETASEDHEDS